MAAYSHPHPPFKELSFEHIESRLKKLVHLERKYLSKRNNDKLIKFKEDISEKQLLKTISTASFMKNQPKRLINWNVFFTHTDYLPLNNNEKIIETKNKRYKIIQETKRQWLNYFLNIYEIKIQEYEAQYQD
ncbi:unnamed protein product [Rotaria socialis]|uniref:Uncharacterized protein n=1 Tax=Rotaria socialis TaxID=392032 RepID=A0A818ZNY1_9BILA|nr:unnamed protein product [Rotaria socialis]